WQPRARAIVLLNTPWPSLPDDEIAVTALGRVGIRVVHEHRDGTAHGVLHPVIDDGVVGGTVGRRHHVQDHAVGRPDLDGLHAVADVGGMAVVPHAIPDAGDGMHGRGFVDHGVDVVEAHTFTGLGFQCEA